jgi:glutamyl-tRNA reductase
MEKSIRFISISHKTASVSQREVYCISEEEKIFLADRIRHNFPDIIGLFLLSTCNRTEIYFESSNTSCAALLDFFIDQKAIEKAELQAPLFTEGNTTKESLRHLLEVSSGLASSVIGDAEIIHQIKKAYQFSIRHKLQGSLLERAMQTVFRAHKRISNETNFRDGSTSLAYKALKVVSDTFTKTHCTSKKILLIGTGEIVTQVLKYNSKFNFNSIYIANRTLARAIQLSEKYSCKTYEWQKVVNNEFDDFDVIISAVSNCHHLIKNIRSTSKHVLLIDLALPGNIDWRRAQKKHMVFYDLDTITVELEDAKERRSAAITQVKSIIVDELASFMKWHEEGTLRLILADYKIQVNTKVEAYFEKHAAELDKKIIPIITNQIIRKTLKHKKKKIDFEGIEAFIVEKVSQDWS